MKMTQAAQLTGRKYAADFRAIVAIPCFNEEDYIGDVIRRASKHIREILVIDDGSYDETGREARAAGALVINHDVNMGYGCGIRSCFEAAKASNADIMVHLDGDGQHEPDEIPRVLAPIINGEADIVIGSRFMSQTTRKTMPLYRKLGILLITFLFNFGAKTKVSDTQSGFRAYRKDVLHNISPTEKGMGVSVEVLIKAREKGYNIVEVPIICFYHRDSSTLNPAVHGFSVALTVVKLRFKGLLSRVAGWQ
ncbi:glycosyltransferase family 2 protein [Chloroflexota bacterium]